MITRRGAHTIYSFRSSPLGRGPCEGASGAACDFSDARQRLPNSSAPFYHPSLVLRRPRQAYRISIGRHAWGRDGYRRYLGGRSNGSPNGPAVCRFAARGRGAGDPGWRGRQGGCAASPVHAQRKKDADKASPHSQPHFPFQLKPATHTETSPGWSFEEHSGRFARKVSLPSIKFKDKLQNGDVTVCRHARFRLSGGTRERRLHPSAPASPFCLLSRSW